MHPLLSSMAFLCLLVLPLAAQDEALLGTWEGRTDEVEVGESVVRLTFEADGSFAMRSVFQGDLFANVPEVWRDRDLLPSAESTSFHATGTYETAGDSLWIEVGELSLLVDDEDYFEFFNHFARTLAQAVADATELPEEDYPAFEQEFVDEFLPDLDKEVQTTLGEDRGYAYAIAGDTLFITAEGEVETWEFHRLDAASAVAQATWGRLKAAWRP